MSTSDDRAHRPAQSGEYPPDWEARDQRLRYEQQRRQAAEAAQRQAAAMQPGQAPVQPQPQPEIAQSHYAPQFDRYATAYENARPGSAQPGAPAPAPEPAPQRQHQVTQPVSAYQAQTGAAANPAQPTGYYMPRADGHPPQAGSAQPTPAQFAQAHAQAGRQADAAYAPAAHAQAAPQQPAASHFGTAGQVATAYQQPQGGGAAGYQPQPQQYAPAPAAPQPVHQRHVDPLAPDGGYAAGPVSVSQPAPVAQEADRTAEELRSYFEQARSRESEPVTADWRGDPAGHGAGGDFHGQQPSPVPPRGGEQPADPIGYAQLGQPAAPEPFSHDPATREPALFDPMAQPELDDPRRNDSPYGQPGGQFDGVADFSNEAMAAQRQDFAHEPQFEAAGAGEADYYSDEYDDAGEPATGGRRGLMVVGALVAAIGVGGALGFAYKFMSGSSSQSSGKTPVVLADRTPLKTKPRDPGGKLFDNQSKSIYDRLSGSGTRSANNARVVPRGEKVQPRGKVSGDRLNTGSNGIGLRGNSSGFTQQGALAAAEAALNGGQGQAGAAKAKVREKVAGVRRVQTVRVNPDGTFSKPIRAVRKKIAANVATGDQSGFAIPGISLGSTSSAQSTAVVNPKPKPKLRQAARKTAAKQGLGTAKPRAVPKKIRVANVARPAAAAPTGAGGYVVQVSARRSLQDALAAFVDLRQKYTSLLGAKQPDIQEADLGTRGKWYRVRVGPPVSKQAAGDLCKGLKSAGWKGCIVKAY